MTEQNQRHFMPLCGADLSGPDRKRVLAIGDMGQWESSCGKPPGQDDVRFAGIEDLNAGLLMLLQPRLILSPVVASDFDCLDVSCLLNTLDYDGCYRAVTRRLPNPNIVRREVRLLYPKLDFDILQIDAEPAYAN